METKLVEMRRVRWKQRLMRKEGFGESKGCIDEKGLVEAKVEE